MKNTITLIKVSDFLYDVKINGKDSLLSVWCEQDGTYFCSYFGFYAHSLKEMKKEILSKIEEW